MRQRRLNVPLLAWLAGGAMLAFAALFTIHYFQVRDKAGTLYTLAEDAREEGDLRKAAGYLLGYVKFRPDDQQGYVAWANVLADIADSPDATRKDIERAQSVLEAAAIKAPDDEPLRRRLIDLNLRARRTKDARQHLDVLIAAQPDDADLQFKYAQCLIAEARYGEVESRLYRIIGYDLATKTFDPAKALDAKSIDAYVLLADLLQRQLESPEVAEQVMNQLVTVNSDSYRAYLQRGGYYLRRDALEAAKRDIAKAVELEPGAAEVLLSAAELAVDEKQFDTAREHLARGARDFPDDERMYQSLASLELQESRNLDEALKHIAAGLAARPNSFLLLSYQAYLQLQRADLPAVRATLETMQQAGVPADTRDLLAAQILMVERKWHEAARQLERLRPHFARQVQTQLQIDQLLGQAYESLGQFDRALAAFRSAQAADARSLIAQRGVERMMRATGRPRADKPDPLRRQLLTMLAEPEEQRDWQAIEPVVDQFIANRGLSAARQQVLRAELLLLQDRFDEAEAVMAEARNQHRQTPRVWLASAGLMMRKPQGGIDDALAMLDEAQTALGNPVELRLARAYYLSRAGRDRLDDGSAALEANLDDFTDQDRYRLLSGLARIYLSAQMPNACRRCWQRLAKLDPGNLRVRMDLFELAHEQNDVDSMRDAMDEIFAVTKSKTDSTWQYCQAALLTSLVQTSGKVAGRLDEAERLLDLAVKQRPDWYKLHLQLANINVLKRDYDRAIECFTRAFELGPAGTASVRQLVQLLSLKGRFGEARSALALLNKDRRQGVLPELQAEIHLRTGDAAEGVRLAREAVLRDPENAMKQLWYAQVLVRSGEPKLAESALRRAVLLDPKVPVSWLALVGYLHRQDRDEDAARELQRGAEQVPADHRNMLLGQGSELLGNSDQAAAYYQKALAEDPDNLTLARRVASFYLSSTYSGSDGQIRARQLLRKILDDPRSKESSNEAIAWARRTQARMIAAGGTYPDLQKALALIETNALEGRLRPEDQLAQASILAVRPEAVSRRKAIRLFQEVQAAQGLPVREQLLLAGLFNRADDWPNCREQMQDLLVEHGDNLAILAAYCKMLIRRNQLDQAQRWSRKLDELDPQSKATLQTKARLLAKLGKSQAAAALIQEQVPAEINRESLPQLGWTISMLNQIEQHDQAIELLRKYAAVEPRAVLSLASLLGQYGDIDEAFAILREAEKVQPLASVLQVAIDVVRARRDEVAERYDSEIQSWLDRRQAEAPSDLGTRLLLASFRGVQDNYEEEERLYRELLEHKDLPRNQRALVLNNLAFNLALRDRADAAVMQLVTNAIAIHGPTGALLDTRAMVSLSLGDVERAISDLQLAISDQGKPIRYFHLALAQLARGDRQAAHGAYVEAERRGLIVDQLSVLERKKHKHLVRELGLKAAQRGA